MPKTDAQGFGLYTTDRERCLIRKTVGDSRPG